ncbi:MAG: SDR family NAD(P)-dependent oxidoreductase [Alphaproteobacteria bacterium]
MTVTETALIVGAGAGLSASLARAFVAEGMQVALASREPEKLAGLVEETGAGTYASDSSVPDDVTRLFAAVEADIGPPDIVVYNPSFRVRGPLIDLDPAAVAKAIAITCFGGFLVGQAAARGMLRRGHGSILFTGASASIKGYPQSAAFAMGKFGLRGLTQSMARELGPQNIHVAHFVIDGGIRPDGGQGGAGSGSDNMLEPDAIAANYLQVHRQHRSTWSSEVAIRPWSETF